jgi:hypothetical protein
MSSNGDVPGTRGTVDRPKSHWKDSLPVRAGCTAKVTGAPIFRPLILLQMKFLLNVLVRIDELNGVNELMAIYLFY